MNDEKMMEYRMLEKNHKQIVSEFNILKKVHAEVIDKYTTDKVNNWEKTIKQKIQIKELKMINDELTKSYLVCVSKSRENTLREVLDAMYESDQSPFSELCITQKQYKIWDDEVNNHD